jgi:tetratricopeptide (TPR) repeat protein
MSLVHNLEAMLASGQDSPLIRFGLGNALIAERRHQAAADHLRAALELDPNYSAAWKLLGKAYAELGDLEAAIAAFKRGMKVAEAKGDIQSVKEMDVFLRRLQPHKLLGAATVERERVCGTAISARFRDPHGHIAAARLLG